MYLSGLVIIWQDSPFFLFGTMSHWIWLLFCLQHSRTGLWMVYLSGQWSTTVCDAVISRLQFWPQINLDPDCLKSPSYWPKSAHPGTGVCPHIPRTLSGFLIGDRSGRQRIRSSAPSTVFLQPAIRQTSIRRSRPRSTITSGSSWLRWFAMSFSLAILFQFVLRRKHF